MICYIYYNESKNDYLLSLKNETESIPINVNINNAYDNKVVYYAKLHFHEGYDSISYASNNKKNICEFIYDYLELSVDNDVVYYVSGEMYKTNDKCILKNKHDVINYMMNHDTDEYSILVA